MTDPNRNQQQNASDRNTQTGPEGGSFENPQEGTQWDNYQTRSLSSEGDEKIEESDLLRADEAKTEPAGNTPGA